MRGRSAGNDLIWGVGERFFPNLRAIRKGKIDFTDLISRAFRSNDDVMNE